MDAQLAQDELLTSTASNAALDDDVFGSPEGAPSKGETAETPEDRLAPRVVTVIEPRSGWRLIDWKELYAYRDLFFFLVWRSVKVRYAQSAIGIGWAVIQPVFSMLVFTIIFGKLAGIESDGVPYAVFSFAALVPWTYFANALTDGTSSLITNSSMISKVYFPRPILPLSAVFAKLVDFSIAMTLLFGLMAWYRLVPTASVVLLPLLILLMMLTAAGLGMWLTALAIQYRDVQHAMSFVVQLLMYAAPVVYPASLIPDRYQLFYALNPMVGVIEGFRAVLLGTRPVPWDLLAVGTPVALVIALSGLLYFRSRERLFADVA
jgi:lipopolysaccharide transport system permease protein